MSTFRFTCHLVIFRCLHRYQLQYHSLLSLCPSSLSFLDLSPPPSLSPLCVLKSQMYRQDFCGETGRCMMTQWLIAYISRVVMESQDNQLMWITTLISAAPASLVLPYYTAFLLSTTSACFISQLILSDSNVGIDVQTHELTSGSLYDASFQQQIIAIDSLLLMLKSTSQWYKKVDRTSEQFWKKIWLFLPGTRTLELDPTTRQISFLFFRCHLCMWWTEDIWTRFRPVTRMLSRQDNVAHSLETYIIRCNMCIILLLSTYWKPSLAKKQSDTSQLEPLFGIATTHCMHKRSDIVTSWRCISITTETHTQNDTKERLRQAFTMAAGAEYCSSNTTEFKFLRDKWGTF